MGITPGDDIGAYEIISPLGTGGMAEVYRARDKRLGREVALKVLPEALAREPDRLRRFSQEACAVAALEHPNVLAVHDVGAHDGAPYLVMELLEGATLRERLREGPLPLRKALDYAVQIAAGLAAAHAKGIVHRDLKPENVFVTKDGRVKVLDFGLAKALGREVTATQATVSETGPGAVLGTAGYMSPEQLRGQAVDGRSDVFAFGAVLYEMLAGRPAFPGESHIERGHAVLNADPPELTTAVPPALDRVMRRCLEKTPDERFQSMRDLGFALAALSNPSGPAATAGAAASAKARPHGHRLARAVGALAVALPSLVAGWLGAGWLSAMLHRDEAEAGVFSGAKVAHVRRLTHAHGAEDWPALAPDGTWFVYVRKVDEQLHVFRQRVGGEQPQDLTADSRADNTQPTIAPDGQRIAFRSSRDGGGIFIMGATGESVRRLTDFGYHPSFAPDGDEVALSSVELFSPLSWYAAPQVEIVRVDTGARRALAAGPVASLPVWSPDGRWLAYFAVWGGGQRGLALAPSAGGEERRLTLGSAVVWTPVFARDGRHLYFASNTTGVLGISRVAVDLESGTFAGEPETVMGGIGLSLEKPTLSADGRLMLVRAVQTSHNIARVPFDARRGRVLGPPELLTRGINSFNLPDVSPDGTWLTFDSAFDPGTQEDIYVMRADGTGLRRVTDDPARDRGPHFTHDGNRIVFATNRLGTFDIWSVGRDGAGLIRLGDTGLAMSGPVPSPVDARIAVPVRTEKSVITVIFDGDHGMDAEGSTRLAFADGTIFEPWEWSADGKELLGIRYDNVASFTSTGVMAYSFANERLRELWPEGEAVVPLRDGRRLLMNDAKGRVLLVDPTATAKEAVEILARSASPVGAPFALSPDERWIYVTDEQMDADLWLIELR